MNIKFHSGSRAPFEHEQPVIDIAEEALAQVGGFKKFPSEEKEDTLSALSIIRLWPAEVEVQVLCLEQCIVHFDTYEDWWNSHTSGVSRLIRKLVIEEHIGRKITWEEYEVKYGE